MDIVNAQKERGNTMANSDCDGRAAGRWNELFDI
jgi:hypothetical protein